jgi:hypothetical protein
MCIQSVHILRNVCHFNEQELVLQNQWGELSLYIFSLWIAFATSLYARSTYWCQFHIGQNSILFTAVLPRLFKVWRSRGYFRTTKNPSENVTGGNKGG